MSDKPDIATQTRCVNCLREQYAPAVWSISHGKHPCVWCGHTPPQMTKAEYSYVIKRARKVQS